MNASATAVEQYLTTRRALGFKLKPYGRMLLDFVGYLERSGASTVTTDLAVAWARQPTNAHPRWWNRRLGVVRGFARYLQAFDPATEVPPTDLLPCHDRRTAPYLYSSADITELLQAASRLRSPLQAATYQTLISLADGAWLSASSVCSNPSWELRAYSQAAASDHLYTSESRKLAPVAVPVSSRDAIRRLPMLPASASR
jgi:hypothetical protein